MRTRWQVLRIVLITAACAGTCVLISQFRVYIRTPVAAHFPRSVGVFVPAHAASHKVLIPAPKAGGYDISVLLHEVPSVGLVRGNGCWGSIGCVGRISALGGK
jgi:hypothetical protein